jgi:hypothetical protein
MFENGMPGSDLGERDRVRGQSASRLRYTFMVSKDPLTPTLSPTLSPVVTFAITLDIDGDKVGERGDLRLHSARVIQVHEEQYESAN